MRRADSFLFFVLLVKINKPSFHFFSYVGGPLWLPKERGLGLPLSGSLIKPSVMQMVVDIAPLFIAGKKWCVFHARYHVAIVNNLAR